MVLLKVIVKGLIESGLKMPISGYTVFINNPMTIKNERLSPTDNRSTVVRLSLFSFRI
jgi:hypothetical protein